MSNNNWPNRHYVIMSHPQPSEAWDSGVCGTAATKRLSLDETKVLMKWDGDTPPYFEGVQTYTHSKILEILAGPEWTDPDPHNEEGD
tara:strand:+ start:799 stop:1059 length:261 start_codon:yes stop_codon:yes gene_type:complete